MLPSTLWVADEQAKWPLYDLVGSYVPTGATAEVADIVPLQGGRGSEYEIVVDFLTAPTGRSQAARTLALQGSWRVTRQDGRWRIASILPVRTRTWRRATVGRITYHLEPGLSFDPRRARLAARYIDSLADAFALPRLPRLDYYKTTTVDAALDALGATFPQHFGAGGGFAKPVNGQVFAAVPAWGEDYRHELTHVVLLPVIRGRNFTLIGTEGIATWLGGSAGNDFPGTVAVLRDYLQMQPRVNLDTIMTSPATPQMDLYASGAVLCDMVYRKGGVPALKEFLTTGPGPEQLRPLLARLLGEPWSAVLADWRRSVGRLSDVR